MSKKSAAQNAVDLLNKTDLSIEDRSMLTSCLLDRLCAYPLSDIITVDNGSLYIKGKGVDLETATKLRESAKGALANFALNTIYEQVKFEAIVTGFIKADSEKQSFFGKAAIWWGEREAYYLKLLAQVESSEPNP